MKLTIYSDKDCVPKYNKNWPEKPDLFPTEAYHNPMAAKSLRIYKALLQKAKNESVPFETQFDRNRIEILINVQRPNEIDFKLKPDTFYSVDIPGDVIVDEQRRYLKRLSGEGDWTRWYYTEPSWAQDAEFESRKVARIVAKDYGKDFGKMEKSEWYSKAYGDKSIAITTEGEYEMDNRGIINPTEEKKEEAIVSPPWAILQKHLFDVDPPLKFSIRLFCVAAMEEWAEVKSESLRKENSELKKEIERKTNDLLDALDLKAGNGPTALSMLSNRVKELEKEIERLKERALL